MDASEDAKGSAELDQAEKHGLLRRFQGDQEFPGLPQFSCRLQSSDFTPADPNAGLPIIIYLMGKLCDAIRTWVKTDRRPQQQKQKKKRKRRKNRKSSLLPQ